MKRYKKRVKKLLSNKPDEDSSVEKYCNFIHEFSSLVPNDEVIELLYCDGLQYDVFLKNMEATDVKKYDMVDNSLLFHLELRDKILYLQEDLYGEGLKDDHVGYKQKLIDILKGSSEYTLQKYYDFIYDLFDHLKPRMGEYFKKYISSKLDDVLSAINLAIESIEFELDLYFLTDPKKEKELKKDLKKEQDKYQKKCKSKELKNLKKAKKKYNKEHKMKKWSYVNDMFIYTCGIKEELYNINMEILLYKNY